MSQPIDRRRIDPIDPEVQRMAHRRKRVGIVLRPPAIGPATAADRPRAESEPGDIHAAAAEWPCGKRHLILLSGDWNASAMRMSGRVDRDSGPRFARDGYPRGAPGNRGKPHRCAADPTHRPY